MKRRSKAALLAAGVTLGLLTGGAGAVLAVTGDEPPPRPPWQNADGSVDTSKVPDRMPVADETGRIVGYISGADAFAPPPPLVNGKPQPEKAVRVFDDSGNMIGVMTPGRGFVPTGK